MPAMDLHAWRHKHKLNQADAALRVGITQSYYCRLERGARSPSAHVVRQIVTATHGAVTADDLLGTALEASAAAQSSEGV